MSEIQAVLEVLEDFPAFQRDLDVLSLGRMSSSLVLSFREGSESRWYPARALVSETFSHGMCTIKQKLVEPLLQRLRLQFL